MSDPIARYRSRKPGARPRVARRQPAARAHRWPLELVMDSPPEAGPSPVETLAFALAGCMAMDVLAVVRRGRFALDALSAHLVAERAAGRPEADPEGRPALHADGRGPGRPCRARDPALARQVLLGLALDAHRHRAHDLVRGRPSRRPPGAATLRGSFQQIRLFALALYFRASPRKCPHHEARGLSEDGLGRVAHAGAEVRSHSQKKAPSTAGSRASARGVASYETRLEPDMAATRSSRHGARAALGIEGKPASVRSTGLPQRRAAAASGTKRPLPACSSSASPGAARSREWEVRGDAYEVERVPEADPLPGVEVRGVGELPVELGAHARDHVAPVRLARHDARVEPRPTQNMSAPACCAPRAKGRM